MNVLPAPIEVFYSYAGADESLRIELDKHLSQLRRDGLITTWHKRQIIAGMDWTKALDQHLNTASIILLLVSSDFVDSDYCYGTEMQRAMERYERGVAHVVPILLRPCDRQNAPFEKLQALPSNGIPITLWSNQDAAFADVSQSIRVALQERKRLVVSTPSTILPPIWNIPYQRNLMFTGREEILTHLADTLKAGQATALSQPHAITGLGGIGKTQIAVEYAYLYRQEYQAVFWTLADTHESLVSGYVAIARLLNLPEKDEQDQTIVVKAVVRWLTTYTDWLLILDNADDLTVVRELVPSVFGGRILLTTRALAMGRLARSIEIDTMPQDIGALFLLRRALLIPPDAHLDDATPTDETLAREICEEMGGLPLALDQAGAYIEEVQCSLSDYQQRYRTRRTYLLQRRGGQVADHPDPVATTWSLSFEKVEQRSPIAADLLRLCAFLHPDAIPMELIAQSASHLGPFLASVAGDDVALDETIATLVAYSLLHRNPTTATLSIHRLVQAVLADGMDAQTQHLWAERVIIALNASLPDAEDRQWNRYERCLNHLLNGVDLIDRWLIHIPAAAYLLHNTARYLHDRARYAEAKPLYLRTLQIQRQALGRMHPEIIEPLFYLANLYQEEGQYLEAENLYQEVWEICEHTLAPDDPRAISAICALARNYFLQDEYDLALMFYHTALQAEKPPKLTTLNDAGQVYQKMGHYTGAELLYQQALEICEQTPEPNTLDTFIPITSLATLYHEQGEYDRAEALYRRALHLSEQTLGSDHPDLSSSLHNLAELYQDQRRYDEAEPLYLRALHLLEQTLGPDHLRVTSMLNGLATLRARQGQYAEAKLLFQRVLQIREQILGPAHSEVALSLFNLATSCTEQGQYTEAEPLFQRALQIQERLLGSTHFKIAHALSNLAQLYIRQGHATKAVEVLERALDIWKKTLGLNHPQARSTATMYARALRLCGRYDEGKNLEAQLLPSSFQEEEQNLLQVLHLRERTFGSDHPEVAASLNSLAAIYLEQDRLSEAEQFCRRALDIYEQKNHQFASATRVLLATIRISLAGKKSDTKLRSNMMQSLTSSKQRLHHV
jgi:tetratricopeptide (TPR) repeat protein